MSDLLDLIDQMEAASIEWTGAPLAYTADYYTPEELDDAFKHYILVNGRLGCVPNSHMWHRGAPTITAREHEGHFFSADARCGGRFGTSEHDHTDAPLPGSLMHQANCPPCRWHVIGSWNSAVEAWHDHTMPGWRELPAMPATIKNTNGGNWRGTRAAMAWLDANQPADWRFDGAPVRTERAPNARRHVEGRSPWGGFDLAATQETPA